METIGVVRFVPPIVFFAKSIRRKAGAPISPGRPFVQFSPETQSIALMVAQINSFDPSKSAPNPDPNGASVSPATSDARTNFQFFTDLIECPPLLYGIAATFHTRSESTVERVNDFLLLGDCLLVARVALLPCLSPAYHCTGYGSDAGALTCVTRNRTNCRASRSAP